MSYFAIPGIHLQHKWYIDKAIRIPEHINNLRSELGHGEKNHVSYPNRHSDYLLSLIPSQCNTTKFKKNKKKTCLFNLLSQAGEKYDRQKGCQYIEVTEEKSADQEEIDSDADECYKDEATFISTMEYTDDNI